MPKPIHDFSQSITNLKWAPTKAAYHQLPGNLMKSDAGTPASSLDRGLYLYLYSNQGSVHPIHNRNIHHEKLGRIICPPNGHTLKSGKFMGGLHEHIRKNLHGHLWRPNATPVEDHIMPQVICWFLVFDTDPVASAPRETRPKTREKYFNGLVRDWLSTLDLKDPHQDQRLEHRWIPPQLESPPISARQGREFLDRALKQHQDW